MKSFTRDLIVWIEQNLDKKIMLNKVASKAGYSKWYLQRLFLQETGINLATYIRQRRLSESAILLKMTDMPVIDAAERFGFSNQQTYTRTFGRHFSMPPGQYRVSRDWHFGGLQPSLNDNCDSLPQPEVVSLTLPPLQGITFSYICPSETLGNPEFHAQHLQRALQSAESQLMGKKPRYIAERYEPAGMTDSIRFVLTFYCDTDGEAQRQETPVDGRFLRFRFDGNINEMVAMQADIYRHILPGRAEARRDGSDIFSLDAQQGESLDTATFSGYYHLPVTHEQTLAAD